MKQQYVNPRGTETLRDRFGFSQAVRVGETVWVSGQVGWDDECRAAEGIEAQSRLAFENLRRVLTEAGTGLGDVVDLVTFHRDMAELEKFAKVKGEFLGRHCPAWTAIGTPALAFPELLVEVRAVAVVGSGGRAP